VVFEEALNNSNNHSDASFGVAFLLQIAYPSIDESRELSSEAFV
jgi:hypothetical protein